MKNHIDLIRELNDEQIKTLVCDYMALSQTGVLPADSFFQEMCYKICAHVGQSYNITILDGILKMEVYNRFVSNGKA